MRKIFSLVLLFLVLIMCGGCELPQRKPLTVTFVDVSGAMSTDHTIKVSFAEEKDYKEKFIDILVKTDKDVQLTLFQQFAKDDDKIVLNITKDMGYISLDEYKLFNLEEVQTDSMVGYGDALETTLVVNSNKDATLIFLAVLGEKEDGSFKKVGVVSKEYILNVKEKTDSR